MKNVSTNYKYDLLHSVTNDDKEVKWINGNSYKKETTSAIIIIIIKATLARYIFSLFKSNNETL